MNIAKFLRAAFLWNTSGVCKIIIFQDIKFALTSFNSNMEMMKSIEQLVEMKEMHPEVHSFKIY